MQHLPVFVDIRKQPCLVVGAGTVAGRKAALLRRAGANVTLVAPMISDELRQRVTAGDYEYREEAFRDDMLQGQTLVIAATADAAVNRQVAAAADERNVICNVVDDLEQSRFILPAIVDRDPVTVAISTAGNAPVLARQLKSALEAWLPPRIGELARRAGRWRDLVSRRFRSPAKRRRFWQRFFDGPIAADLLGGRVARAEAAMRRVLIDPVEEADGGEAWIVGAGPGDPGLLTLRAQQLLSRADVVLYDSLVSNEVLDMARKEAELIDVGKRAGGRRVEQDDINALLVERVRAGQRVCRLKGGDPFIFGRGGEEVAALAKVGLRFEVVPGISAAPGCAAAAGIPLTLRGISGSVTFATASLADNSDADWDLLARPGQTLALYMSLGKLASVAGQLIRHGLPASTPAAVIADGTTARQQQVFAPLSAIAARTRQAGIRAPAMLFVGAAIAHAVVPATASGRQAVVPAGPAADDRRAVVSA